MLTALLNTTRMAPLRQLAVTISLSAMMCFVTSAHAIAVKPDVGGKPIQAYLPNDVTFDPAIPTPESVLGANVGEWHVRHDQLVSYMRILADRSDRITIEETGRTHENRPLLLLKITTPENHSKLEDIRKAHTDAITTGEQVSKTTPLIFYMGYSIHGNEPSGANASLAIAYYLAAAKGELVDTLLKENIVLLDPSFNPDGLSRFAQWANMHKGKQLVSDGFTREHDEGWPSGRTNHYWFDLNRDWLLLTHPESRARIKQFQKWRPHILTDFHEMGTDSTYFFQPGVRSRKNPITPDENVTLTEALAKFHAKAFDESGTLYFSEEAFDDFYVGKGSTYPDVHGSIGILFEQASSRGHLQSSINGDLAFSDTIANQITTSLSTFRGALANKPAILDYQSAFVNDTKELAKNDDVAGYVLAMPKDNGRVEALLALLAQHKIKYDVLNQDTKIEGVAFNAKHAIYIPVAQPQYRLVKSLFSTQTSFENNTFYDVSTWNLALAFNLDYQTVDKRNARSIKTSVNASLEKVAVADALPTAAYAYAFSWNDYYAPALLQALLENGVSVRSSEEGFSAVLTNGNVEHFDAGSIIIPTGLAQPSELVTLLSDYASSLAIDVKSIKTGLTPAGNDVGSRSMAPVLPPKVLIVGGEGTSEYEVGEIWHYFDTRVGLPVSIVEQQKLQRAISPEYTHIIFVSGRYMLSDDTKSQLSAWVKAGGTLIGQKSALRYFAKNDWLDVDILERHAIDDAFDERNLTYGDRSALFAKKLVAGSVYEANIDTSHPLFYGYEGDTLPMFKTSNMVVKSNNSPFTTPSIYTSAPLMAGFSHQAMVELIADTASVVTTKQGNGVVIGFTDDTQFRGYWYGTNKMLSNAIYQSHFIR